MSQILNISDDTMECPLCLGKGQLRRVEVLERLGMKDFTRVAELSAEQTFRLLLNKHKEDEGAMWRRFESELDKRTGDISAHHQVEMQRLKDEKSRADAHLSELLKNQEALVEHAKESEKLEIKGIQADLEHALRSERLATEDLNRKVEDYRKEIDSLRNKKQELETELSNLGRAGRREEIEFAAEARTWPGLYVSDKLAKHGDYILAYRDPSGAVLEPRMVVDNKDKSSITEGDVDKLVRDAKEHKVQVGIVVTHDEDQLRQSDKEQRWASKNGIFILRTTRQWLPRDLEILKPMFDRLRTEGPDFLQSNISLAEEVRRSFAEVDGIDKELKKATTAIKSASDLVAKYKTRLELVCEASCSQKPISESVTSISDQYVAVGA